MRMMKMVADEIVDMVAMGDRLVPAAGTVDVARLMAFALVAGRARVGVHVRNFKRMLDNPATFLMVEMPVMQIIDMIPVPNCGVTAT
jgi:hypothetical protein